MNQEQIYEYIKGLADESEGSILTLSCLLNEAFPNLEFGVCDQPGPPFLSVTFRVGDAFRIIKTRLEFTNQDRDEFSKMGILAVSSLIETALKETWPKETPEVKPWLGAGI